MHPLAHLHVPVDESGLALAHRSMQSVQSSAFVVRDLGAFSTRSFASASSAGVARLYQALSVGLQFDPLTVEPSVFAHPRPTISRYHQRA